VALACIVAVAASPRHVRGETTPASTADPAQRAINRLPDMHSTFAANAVCYDAALHAGSSQRACTGATH